MSSQHIMYRYWMLLTTVSLLYHYLYYLICWFLRLKLLQSFASWTSRRAIHSKTFDTTTTSDDKRPPWFSQVGYLDAVAILTEAKLLNRHHPSGIISNLALWTGYGLGFRQVFKPPSVKRIHWSLDENSAVEEFSRFSNDSRMIEWQIVTMTFLCFCVHDFWPTWDVHFLWRSLPCWTTLRQSLPIRSSSFCCRFLGYSEERILKEMLQILNGTQCQVCQHFENSGQPIWTWHRKPCEYYQ